MTSADSSADLSAPSSDALPDGCIQRVLPAGALRETRWVLLAMALTLLVSMLAVGWQRRLLPQERLQAHQIDLSTGLSTAEQGIYTDLQAVYDEWQSMNAPLPPPTPKHWADEGWPPFIDDLTAQQRGRRQWRLLTVGDRYAYLGTGGHTASSSAPSEQHATPRVLLWRLPETHAIHAMTKVKGAAENAHSDESPHTGFDLWLHEADTTPDGALPESLDEASLIRHGWRQAVAHLRAEYPRPPTRESGGF